MTSALGNLKCSNLILLAIFAIALFGLSTERNALSHYSIPHLQAQESRQAAAASPPSPPPTTPPQPLHAVDATTSSIVTTAEDQRQAEEHRELDKVEITSTPSCDNTSSTSSSAAEADRNTGGKNVNLQLCSPRIRGKKVLFVQVATMEIYNDPEIGISRGGEDYVFASLDWALRQIGVEVHQLYTNFEELSIEYLAQFDRIFRNGPAWHPDFDERPDVVCKVRVLAYFGNHLPVSDTPYVHRQFLSPYPEDYNTFLGFFPHVLVSQNRTLPNKQRGKEGLIMGKAASLFQTDADFIPAMKMLLDNGFVLHAVCKDDVENNCGLPRGIHVHPHLLPHEYANLITRMAFLIGAGEPSSSPSPFVGLAQGAAWLNVPSWPDQPLLKVKTLESLQKFPLHWMLHPPNSDVIITQHNPISKLGAPYVYNVDLANHTTLLQSAYRAVRYRFSPYTPPQFRPGAMIDRVCGLMEDDSLCECPVLKEKYKSEDPTWHCEGSSYIINKPGI